MVHTRGVIEIGIAIVTSVKTQCESKVLSVAIVIVNIRMFPFPYGHDNEASDLVSMNCRKRSRRSGKKSGPIIEHYFLVLHLKEMERFSKVTKMTIFGNFVKGPTGQNAQKWLILEMIQFPAKQMQD